MTGAGGRLGCLLRHCWAGEAGAGVVWQSRTGSGAGSLAGNSLAWGFGPDTPAAWPEDGVILHLAGVTRGTPTELAVNVSLARSLARIARQLGASHVLFASSVAVYRPGPDDLDEDTAPDPVSDYGRAKWDSELALASDLAGSGTGLTCLRIGNVAGADALLGGQAASGGSKVTLDPVPGQPMGPARSYIGPRALARVLAGLIPLAPNLPAALNIAQPGAVVMGDLLNAARLPWGFGPDRPGTVPRVVVHTERLQGLMPVPDATAAGLVADLRSLAGLWP